MHEEYRLRRQAVIEAIRPGVLLVMAAGVSLRNNDVEHDYRQESDFYYLTGLDEPESVLLLSSTEQARSVLFVRPRDSSREAWEGERLGVERAAQVIGVDEAFAAGELTERLPGLLEGHERLYYRLGRSRDIDDAVVAALDRLRSRARHGARWPTAIYDPTVVLHEMRLIKSDVERGTLQKAADLTCHGHLCAMRAAREGCYEYELEAALTHAFLRGGARRHAYPPTVGSGNNATVLHYRANNRRTEAGDLVLVDAGCEYGYYAADVTRTYPVSGRFSGPQRAVYEVVLRAERTAIESARPGVTLESLHDASVRVLTEGMINIGLLEGSLDRALEEKTYARYFMHRTSHWLGMDVHDVGRYRVDGQARPLVPGMAFTVEPGIYVSAQSDAPECYRGIGVRIEDDVLVTDGGCVVMTERVPTHPDEIEAYMAGSA